MKTLYQVRVYFDFVALAHNSGEAEDFADQAFCDMSVCDMTRHCSPLRTADGRYHLPPGYTGRCLAYGDSDENTLDELIAAERAALDAAGGGE
jgi:hypothetical protein